MTFIDNHPPTPLGRALLWMETCKPEKRVLAVEGSQEITNPSVHCFGFGLDVNESLAWLTCGNCKGEDICTKSVDFLFLHNYVPCYTAEL